MPLYIRAWNESNTTDSLAGQIDREIDFGLRQHDMLQIGLGIAVGVANNRLRVYQPPRPDLTDTAVDLHDETLLVRRNYFQRCPAQGSIPFGTDHW
jgi:hypothetical protein